MITLGPVTVKGMLKIYDPVTKEVFVDKTNAIHYENMSIALAQSLAEYFVAGQQVGYIYAMAFGNGGSSVDPTGVITYLPPNVTGQNADLYNQTYLKVVNQNSAANTDPTRNNLTVLHTSGKVYTSWSHACWTMVSPQGNRPLITRLISTANLFLMN